MNKKNKHILESLKSYLKKHNKQMNYTNNTFDKISNRYNLVFKDEKEKLAFKKELKQINKLSFSFGDDDEDEMDAQWKMIEKKILENKYENVNQRYENGYTALMMACEYESKICVQKLIDLKANVNLISEEEYPALMIACDIEYEENGIVDLLLQSGANVNYQTKEGCCALTVACDYGDVGTVKSLIKSKANVNIQTKEGFSGLMFACQKENNDMVKLLLDSGANINLQTKEGETALMFACECEYEENGIVDLLLQSGANVNYQTKEGFCALTIACNNDYGDVGTVESLIESKANVNLQTKEGFSGLMFACQNEYNDIVTLLLDSGANINLQTKEGDTALMLSCMENNASTVSILLQDEKINVNLLNKIHHTALMTACTIPSDVKIVRLLLSNTFINLNLTDDMNYTALMMVCNNAFFDDRKEVATSMVKLLLEHDSKINVKQQSNSGDTALMLACHSHHYPIVDLLLLKTDHSKIINLTNNENKNALMCAIEHTQISYKLIELLVNYPTIDINYATWEGETALDKAISRRDEKIVDILITHPQIRVERIQLRQTIDMRNINELLSKKAMLRDILHNYLDTGRLFTVRNIPHILRLIRTKDFSDNKQYISQEYKQVQQNAKFMTDLLFKPNKTQTEEQSCLSTKLFLGFNQNLVFDVSVFTQEFLNQIIDILNRKIVNFYRIHRSHNILRNNNLMIQFYYLLKIRSFVPLYVTEHEIAQASPLASSIISKITNFFPG